MTKPTNSAKAAKVRREEREKQRQRQQQQYLVIGLIIAAVLVAGLFLISTRPADAPIPEGVTTAYEGLEIGVNDENFPRLGNADAPVQIEEFSSFSCPGCKQFHDDVFPAIVERVRAGHVAFTFVPMLTGSIENAEGAARAALCAGEQGKFWEMHDVLFDWHGRFVNNAFTSNRLSSGAEALGLNMGDFNSCFSSEKITNIIGAGNAKGIASTPTVRVNGQTVGLTAAEITAAIDSYGPFDALPPTDTSEQPTATEEVVATQEVSATTEAMATEEVSATAEAAATEETEATEEAGS